MSKNLKKAIGVFLIYLPFVVCFVCSIVFSFGKEFVVFSGIVIGTITVVIGLIILTDDDFIM